MRPRALPVALAALVAGAAPAAASTGGAEYGGATPASSPPAAATPAPATHVTTRAPGGSGRPVVRRFLVPARATAGQPVTINYRIDGTAGQVRVRLAVYRVGQHRPAYRLDLGAHGTGRVVTYDWPTAPRPGTYTLLLHAVDPSGLSLARTARATGRERMVVAPAVTPDPAPSIPEAPAFAPAPDSLPGVFPVRGAHSFGGADARFGAKRRGHVHQGQDVTAEEGVPVVAPRAGTVTWRAYQAGGAGYYVVLHDDAAPRDYVFMHLRKGSIVVKRGDHVASGAPLGEVGATGTASGPHLHFELWVGGWYARGGSPVDPLSQLQAWGG
jgi:murein DD-endopeptidase MepM/ murein hydrolase activator NlpD